MLYSEIIAVCPGIHTKHKYNVCAGRRIDEGTCVKYRQHKKSQVSAAGI